MATGWRIADASTYEGLPPNKGFRGIATPPGAVSEAFWIVDPGKRFCCLWLALMIQPGDGVLLEVDYDEGDVLEERLLGHESVSGPWTLVDPGPPKVVVGVPEEPVQYRALKISGGTVSVADVDFTEVALAPEGTA